MQLFWICAVELIKRCFFAYCWAGLTQSQGLLCRLGVHKELRGHSWSKLTPEISSTLWHHVWHKKLERGRGRCSEQCLCKPTFHMIGPIFPGMPASWKFWVNSWFCFTWGHDLCFKVTIKLSISPAINFLTSAPLLLSTSCCCRVSESLYVVGSG